jgi:hypothetical protein
MVILAMRLSLRLKSKAEQIFCANKEISQIFLFAALHLLFQKVPLNFAVLTRNGNMFNTR